MASISPSGLSLRRSSAGSHHQLPCLLLSSPSQKVATSTKCSLSLRLWNSRKHFSVTASNTLTANSVEPRYGVYTVGDFMTRKDDLHVVKPSTSVDEALEILAERRITGFPVVDDKWKLVQVPVTVSRRSVESIRRFSRLVGLVSDYDLLALDSVSGTGGGDANIFPEVGSNWKTFNEVQKLISKTKGKVVGDLMTPAPLVVRESTNLEDAARLLLKTKYRRLPVVDSDGKLVGMITRGNVVRAALHIKRIMEMEGQH